MNELEALSIFSQIPLLGPLRIRTLIRFFGTAATALEADVEDIKNLSGFGPKVRQIWKCWEKKREWQENLELVYRDGIKLISFESQEYPKRLLKLPDAPLLLYVKGELQKEDENSISIVGTRKPSQYGLKMAEKLAYELSVKGFTIVSGLARGIDTAVHVQALKQGRTLAVIGSGLSNIYPPENLGLAEEITQKGALISEYPMKTPPKKQNFPRRNRIVTGLSCGTVLIEAPVESGSMHTMRTAFSQRKKLFAIPALANVKSFAGNQRILESGYAKAVQSADDVDICIS